MNHYLEVMKKYLLDCIKTGWVSSEVLMLINLKVNLEKDWNRVLYNSKQWYSCSRYCGCINRIK